MLLLLTALQHAALAYCPLTCCPASVQPSSTHSTLARYIAAGTGLTLTDLELGLTLTLAAHACVSCLQVYLADAFQQFVSVGDWGSRFMAQDGLHLSKAGNDHVWNIMYNAINDKMQLT